MYLGERSNDAVLDEFRKALMPLSASADVIHSWGNILAGSRHALAAILVYAIAADKYSSENHAAGATVEWILSCTQSAISCALRLRRCKSVLNDYVLDYIMYIYDAMRAVPMFIEKASAMCKFSRLIDDVCEAAGKSGRCRICASKGLSCGRSHFSADLKPSYLSANLDIAVSALYNFLPHHTEAFLNGVLSDVKEAKGYVEESSRLEVVEYAEAVRKQMSLFGNSKDMSRLDRIFVAMTYGFFICVLIIIFCMCCPVLTS